MGRELLPNELLWEGQHVTELAVSAIADGEESSLPRDVVGHVHSCDACAMKLGEIALLTRGVCNAVQSAKPWLPAEVVRASRSAAPACPTDSFRGPRVRAGRRRRRRDARAPRPAASLGGLLDHVLSSRADRFA
jgi:hypothetical protein